jgi:hypothetical protein
MRSALHHFMDVSASGGATSPFEQWPLVARLQLADGSSFDFP